MKTRILVFAVMIFAVALGVQFFIQKNWFKKVELDENEGENEAVVNYLRWKYEADMIKDPVTGKVPVGMVDQELEFAKTIPERKFSSAFGRLTTQNTYIPAGPNNVGGRTRALAYDVRYGTGSPVNKVIIAGSISGGIYRSTDGGSNWTRVSPPNEIHNVAVIAQDPRVGFQDTWYAGGGEYIGNSANSIGAGYMSNGIFKSTDNGANWTKILPVGSNFTDWDGSSLSASGYTLERFDHPFDIIHKIAVNPVNGDVYVACHRRIVRSTNGGTSFQTVIGSSVSAFDANGQTDVVISPFGVVYAAMTGAAPDQSLRGIWKSPSGAQNTFTRIAGGSTIGSDSITNWRANSYDFTVVSGSNYYLPKRILMALAPSNDKILYVVYENGLSNQSPTLKPEADLFKLDMTSGANVWSNRSANLPDFPGGDHFATDPFAVQQGYDLCIAVKPNDPNFVVLGGSSLYRSTDGFSTSTNTSWIGGYGNTLPSLTFYPSSHPDFHAIAFNPINPKEVIAGNDGGLQITSDITQTNTGTVPVLWTNLNNYQTLQYYKVAIDPETGANNFAGGAQDNGTYFRDKTGIIGVATQDSNKHRSMTSGDGGSVAVSKKSGSTQYLYSSIQLGQIKRGILQPFSTTFPSGNIQPNGLTQTPGGSGSEFGEFVTNFKLDQDNTEDLYYVNFNRLFRTTGASTVNPSVSNSASWIELSGVSSAISPANGTSIGIRGMALSWGAYNTSHVLYLGTTDGRIFRLDDPRNVSAATTPVDISPPGISGYNVQDIAVNPNNDNEIIAVMSNYGVTSGSNLNNIVNIWWTNNAKSSSPTWKQAEGNLAGTTTSGYISARSCMITVKKDASNNPVTEYYVGTAAGLFAVENLGTTLAANGTPSWQREGSPTLNYAVISSLAYRPADNVLLVGTHGNGLYYAFLGTANFNPVTGINNPILNDENFISQVYPTVNTLVVQYRIGNKSDVKKISIQLYNMQGQELSRKETAYTNGTVDLNNLPKGAYILSIYSDNRKYQHVQKIIR